jgi:maltose alpha-D-glucosyltransferase/alpha-amylase
VLGVMRFWLDLGVDGLRLDAVPYLIEREGTNNENLPETHEVLKRIAPRSTAYPGRMLLAEANQWPEDTKDYFGHGDECHMAFHFPLMPRMYMALAREDRFPITDIMRQTPQIPENCQWAIFLRNHDELTLEMVTDSERDYLWETYAADRRARINLGIRRRLAPLLERDRRRIELMNCLLLSMPGHAGDLLRRRDRHGRQHPSRRPRRRAHADAVVAGPQWRLLARRSGRARAADLDGPALRLRDNQCRSPDARSAFAAALDAPHAGGPPAARRVRPRHAALSLSEEPQGAGVSARARRRDHPVRRERLARAAGGRARPVRILAGRVPVELNGGSLFPPIGQLTYLLTLPPYGFYWFILAAQSEPPAWHTPAPEPMPEYITLVTRKKVADAIQSPDGAGFVRDVVPSYLMKRRWFSAKDQAIRSTRIKYLAPLVDGDREVLLAEIETKSDGETNRWLLPLSVVWDDEHPAALPSQLALARVRRGRRTGLLTDAFTLAPFAHQMLDALASGARIETAEGTIEFEPTESVRETLRQPDNADVLWLSAEQSNSSLIVGDTVMLKIFRKVSSGAHPEAEMSRYLTAQGFANSPALLGEAVRVSGNGERNSLAVAQAFVRNQGDAWTWTLDQFNRALDELSTEDGGDARADNIADYTSIAAMIGRRLGEMHAVLARASEDKAFAPESSRGTRHRDLARARDALLEKAFALVREHKNWDDETLAARAKLLLSQHQALQKAAAASREGRTRLAEDAHSRRLPSRAGAGRKRRCLHHRFRGRAGKAARRAPREGKPVARCRRADAVASIMPPPRRSTRRMSRRRDWIRSSPGSFVTRLRDGAKDAFLDAYFESVGSPRSNDAAARLFPHREGRLRARL